MYFVSHFFFFFFSSRRRHTRSLCDWSSDVCSSDLCRREPKIAGKVPCAKAMILLRPKSGDLAANRGAFGAIHSAIESQLEPPIFHSPGRKTVPSYVERGSPIRSVKSDTVGQRRSPP